MGIDIGTTKTFENTYLPLAPFPHTTSSSSLFVRPQLSITIFSPPKQLHCPLRSSLLSSPPFAFVVVSCFLDLILERQREIMEGFSNLNPHAMTTVNTATEWFRAQICVASATPIIRVNHPIEIQQRHVARILPLNIVKLLPFLSLLSFFLTIHLCLYWEIFTCSNISHKLLFCSFTFSCLWLSLLDGVVKKPNQENMILLNIVQQNCDMIVYRRRGK